MDAGHSSNIFRRAPLAVLLVTALFFLCYGNPVAQDAALSSIPESDRPRLVERLSLLVEYQRTHQWDKLYDLLDDNGGKGRAGYVRQRSRYQGRAGDGLIEFDPRSATYIDREEKWLIEGCAHWRLRGRDEYHSSSVYAKLRDGEWYLSEVGINVLCAGDKDPCAR